MNNSQSIIKTVSNVVKLSVIAILCAFCILISNHYYQIKNYSVKLSKELNIIIFFDKNFKEDVSVNEAIEATGVVFLKEYVNAQEAYLKAVEKNPFLKDISISDAAKSIQAYAVVSPKSIPDEDFLSAMRTTLESIPGVDEIVFNMDVFKQYVEVENLLSFYRKIFFIFIIIIFVLFVFKCIFFIMESESSMKKLVINVFSYLLSSACGFLILWTVCVYVQHTLLLDDVAILSIIPFTASLGIVLD
ncbi:MAG: hypothetical protein LBT18_02695 [Endomicrobium sp.]|jgi:cell division transport system permease protein|nr:hypothetical protein [Endomicrobium sp.]